MVPLDERVFGLEAAPERYSDWFQLIYIDLREDGTAVMSVPNSTELKYYTWEHAWSGPRFYIRLTDRVVLRFMYFVSRDYVSDDLAIDTWSCIKSGWATGQIEGERGMLGYQAMTEGETPEITRRLERLDQLEHAVGPLNNAALPVIMGTLVDTVEQGGVFAILTRRGGIR
jgi:hypothetical protein